MLRTILALYDDLQTAGKVVQALVDARFNPKQISLVANDVSQQGSKLDGAVGKLPGIRTTQIAGIGPAITAGPFATELFADGNKDAGSILAGLIDLGATDADAHFWAEGVRRGGALVSVDTEKDEDVARAEEILDGFNPTNIDDQGAAYQKSGWQGFDAKAEPYTEQQVNDFRTTSRDLPAGQQQKLDVIEEQVQVGKREVEGKKVRVNTRVTERPVQEDITLRSETVTVDRHPVDRPADVNDLNAFQEATIELTEKHEEAVVSKTARVVEEVVIGKQADQHTETVHETVRRKDVDVEGMDKTTTGYADYQTRFRTAYDTKYAKTGSWEEYDPAYHFGYDLANNSQYQGSDWKQVEADAKKQWEAKSPNTWDRFKGAVHEAWDNVTNKN